jgi:PAS domain S-box-containing protein
MEGREFRHGRLTPEDAGPGHRGNVSVIIVDDRSSNRSILARLAEELASDVQVTAFDSPNDALTAVTRAQPDLIITDYKMPEMNGGAFVRALRRLDHAFDVPIIVVTAYEDVQYRYDALQAGASDFLLTPVDRHEFVQRGRNLLTMRRQQKILDRRARARERRQRMKARRRERELHLNEAKFRLVVNSLPALIRAVDARECITFANQYHRTIFGLDPETAAARPIADILAPSDAARHAEANARVRETGVHVSFEETIDDDGAAPRTFLTSKVLLADGGTCAPTVLTISIDISAQKRAEQQAAAAKELAQRANTAKTEFLAKMSHELRTPLNAILGFADVTRHEMLGPLGSDTYRTYQEDIYASARQLLRLIDDLLDVSKLELGRLETYAEPIAPAEVAAQAVRSQTEAPSWRKAVVALTVDPGLPTVRTDPMRMNQILTNLLSNALKYTPSDGRVTVHLGPVHAHASGVRLEVADDGPGMSREEVEIALGRFGRIRHGNDHETDGVGLGLPIAHDIAAALGGWLSVDSARGRGTTVTVELPDLERDGPALDGDDRDD